MWKFIKEREPAATAGVLLAVINLVAILTPWNPNDIQLGAINSTVSLILAWAVRSQVTPVAKLLGN